MPDANHEVVGSEPHPATLAASLQPLERLLFDCLRTGSEAEAVSALGSLADDGWETLLELSAGHLVQPLLSHRLLSQPLRDVVPDRLKPVLRRNVEQAAMLNMRRHRDFADTVKTLHARGIPVIALKGMHLASLVYGDLGMRTMTDIDVIVPARDLVTAGAVLEGLGYTPFKPYHVADGAIPYPGPHLPPFLKPGFTTIEIHWHIVGSQIIGPEIVGPESTTPQSGIAIDVDELWQRAVPARVAGTDCSVLSPEDLLLHLCIHATYLHWCDQSARPWCDIAETIRHYSASLSWPDVVERATRWRCSSGTYLALRMARELLGASIPLDVMESLRPPNFDEDLLRIAARERPQRQLSMAVVRLFNQKGTRAKLRTIFDRIFIPKDDIAELYDVPRSSLRVYGLYAVRLKDTLKHWRAIVGLHRGNRELQDTAHVSTAMEAFLGNKQA